MKSSKGNTKNEKKGNTLSKASGIQKYSRQSDRKIFCKPAGNSKSAYGNERAPSDCFQTTGSNEM